MRLSFLVLLSCVFASMLHAQDFRNYEVGQTRPIAISQDASRLYALHTPADSLLVWSLADTSRPRLVREIKVGGRPVSIRERNKDEVWVVNRLGDSISVVSLRAGRVLDTLQVGDEPSDVAFAKQGARELAFVTVALESCVKIYDASTRSYVASIALVGDEPHALAVSADGKSVFGIIHRSGNGTTVIPETIPNRPPPAKQGPGLPRSPRTGTIVDADDKTWGPILGVDLPDDDLFAIDVATLQIQRTWSRVGTMNFALAVDGKGRIWVGNTDARNRVRHEPVLRGHVVDHRVTRIDPTTQQAPQAIDLNPGVDYTKLPNPAALASALAQPTHLEVASDGSVWVTAFGTDRVAQLDASGRVVARIEIGTTPGTRVAPREKRGPRALALHPREPRLYVLARLSSSLVVVDTTSKKQLREVAFPVDPTPDVVREGRGFLYDAKLSGNGTMSCSSCHIDGGMDGLAWDLGDPNGTMRRIRTAEGALTDLHPLKGPLATQTLKGLDRDAPFHWRGDRFNFQSFNPAFDALLGGTRLAAADMDAFAAFTMTIEHMPNPNQERDRSYSKAPTGESAEDGRVFFDTKVIFGSFKCSSCHTLLSGGSNHLIFHDTTLQTIQPMKVAQLQTVYRRMGRKPDASGKRASGFGLVHDGSDSTVFEFLSRPVFRSIASDARVKRMLERFVLAFDTGTAPSVGWSRSVDASNVGSTDVRAFLDLILAQDAARNCDVVAAGIVDRNQVAMQWNRATQRFESDRAGVTWTRPELEGRIALGAGALTVQGVAPGAGRRHAIDSDRDGTRDGDERARVYGRATPACATLRLHSVAFPEPGSEHFGLVARDAPSRSAVLFLLGGSRASRSIVGIDLLVDLAQAMTFSVPSDARGVALLSLPIPNDPKLRNLKLVAQAVGPSACARQGIEASPGVEFVVR